MKTKRELHLMIADLDSTEPQFIADELKKALLHDKITTEEFKLFLTDFKLSSKTSSQVNSSNVDIIIRRLQNFASNHLELKGESYSYVKI